MVCRGEVVDDAMFGISMTESQHSKQSALDSTVLENDKPPDDSYYYYKSEFDDHVIFDESNPLAWIKSDTVVSLQ